MNWNIPNIIGTPGLYKNNTLLMESEDEDVDAYLMDLGTSDQFLTPNELATSIQNQLIADNAFGTSNWEVKYLNVFGRFQITGGVGFRIVPQPTDDLTTLMGFRNMPQKYDTLAASSYATMLYTPYFDIVSTSLTKNQNVGDNSSSIIIGQNTLARIYLTPDGFRGRQDNTIPSPVYGKVDCDIFGVRPFTIHKEFSNPKQMFWNGTEFLSSLDIALIDNKGRILYSTSQFPEVGSWSGDSAEWQMTLQFTES